MTRARCYNMPKRRKQARSSALSNNLNAEMVDRRDPITRQQARVSVYYRPRDILQHITRKVLAARYVVACVAWCSNDVLLDAMRRCRGVSLVINYDRTLIRKHREEYCRLTPMEGAKSAVSWVRGKGRCLMHHKFCVLLDDDKKPTGVITGSWNWTKQSMKNVEHIVSIDDARVAARFMQEHLSVLKIARPVVPLKRRKRT